MHHLSLNTKVLIRNHTRSMLVERITQHHNTGCRSVGGDTICDGFMHRPWPRAPHFWDLVQFPPMVNHY